MKENMLVNRRHPQPPHPSRQGPRTKTMKSITRKQLEATGRTLYIDNEVLASAEGGVSKGALEFFKIGKYESDDELEEEYASRNLVPATISDLIRFDKENREKLDEMAYVGTHWKNADGKWCFAAFSGWSGEHHVSVDRYGDGWGGGWWFAGVRKSALKTKNLATEKEKQEMLTKFQENGSLLEQ